MNNEGKDAVLSREQVERYYAEVTSPDELGITDPRMKAVFDMALRYRDVLEQEPVATVESLQAEVEMLREKYDAVSVVALNHLRSAEAEKSRANVCKKDAEINAERAESAERKLAEAVAALDILTKEKQMNAEQIARVCHEVNRAYCLALGDTSQPAWEDAPDWQKSSAINGVNFHLANPDAGADHSHNEWLKEKRETGWKYGAIKDSDKKEHPCFVPYEELPTEQKAKDYLFRGTVHALAALTR